MKKRKIHNLALVLAVILMAGSSYVLPVSAGRSEISIDKSSVQEVIDVSKWSNPTEEVFAEGGTIVFPADSSEEARFITKTGALLNNQLDALADATATIQFDKLPAGEKFVMALGLASSESVLGDPGNLEIAFTNDSGFKVAVTAYSQDGDAKEILAAKSLGTGKQVKVDAQITMDKGFRLRINGKEFCNLTLSEVAKGRVGFLQSGSCSVRISEPVIKYYRYDRPETCDIFEDFEKGTFNENLLTSQEALLSYADAPTRVCVEEYNGSQVLMLCNAGPTYLGTMHQYSNFELSFDVPYLTREQEVDENGYLVRGKGAAFGVAFGGEGSDYQDWGYTTSADMVLFNQNSTVSSMNLSHFAQDANYPFFAPECKKGFSVKVSVVDAVVKAYIKWMDETEFKEVLSYEFLGETPLGYVQIWTTGLGNMAIDNLKMVNKDADPNLIEVDYASAAIEIPEDYDYKPLGLVYAPKEEQVVFEWYMLIAGAAVLCVLAFGVAIVIKQIKTKKRKDGAFHEK